MKKLKNLMKKLELKKHLTRFVIVTLVGVTVTSIVSACPNAAAAAEKAGSLVIKTNSTKEVQTIISHFAWNNMFSCFLLEKGATVGAASLLLKNKGLELLQSCPSLINSLNPVKHTGTLPPLLLNKRMVSSTASMLRLGILVGGYMTAQNIQVEANPKSTWLDLLLKHPKKMLRSFKENPKKFIMKTLVGLTLTIFCTRVYVYVVKLQISNYLLDQQSYFLFHKVDRLMATIQELEYNMFDLNNLYKSSQDELFSIRTLLGRVHKNNKECEMALLDTLVALGDSSIKGILQKAQIASLTHEVFKLTKRINWFLSRSKEIIVYSAPYFGSK